MIHKISTTALARTLTDDVARHGAIVVRGISNLVMLKQVLDRLVDSAGFQLTFDPASAPELRDYLHVGSRSAIDGAALGSALGFLVGLLVGEPKALAGLGAVVGGARGALDGVNRVRAGWRLCATWDASSEPVVVISVR